MTHAAEGLDAYPPDTQIAAGPTYLMEMVNDVASVWSKSGQLVRQGLLGTFFGIPPGYGATDPQLLYDVLSGHWFASCTAVDTAGDSQVFVAVSQGSDPTAAWWTYKVTSETGVVADQAMLGVSSDKLTLAWNDYTGITSDDTSSAQFTGQETWVIDKQNLVTGAATVQQTRFGPDKNRFRLVPVRSLTATDTQYLVYNRRTSNGSLGVVAITGTPSNGKPAWTETDIGVRSISQPPAAVQPDSGPPIDTEGSTRLQSAVWQSGALWTSTNTSCTPSGDTAPRACLRLIKIATSGNSPTVTQDFDVAQSGAYLYYPAVMVDGSGNMYTVFSESSPSVYASAAVVGQQVTSQPNSASSSVMLMQGLGVYDCGDCFSSKRNGVRWGDYSGAAIDPSNPSAVWLAGEFAASATDKTDWGTAIGPYTFSPQTATPTSPPVTSTATVFFPTLTPTMPPTPTQTPTLTPPQPATQVPTAPLPTVTPVPTMTPAPTISIAIDKVEILHLVNRHYRATTSLRLGEIGRFVVRFHYVEPRGLSQLPLARTTGEVNIAASEGSNPITQARMKPTTRPGDGPGLAFKIGLRFKQRWLVGQLTAHFTVRLRTASDTRSMNFKLRAGP